MNQSEEPFLKAFRGPLTSTLRWPDFEKTLQSIRNQPDAWYIYQVGTEPPENIATKDEVITFTHAIDKLIRQDHQEDYCGVVYTNSFDTPTFIKFYDPNNLGVSCGFSDDPPLPGWVMSKIKPINLPNALNPANNRKRWWQKIFS